MSVHTKMVMLIMCRCEIEEYKQMARKKLYGTQKKKKKKLGEILRYRFSPCFDMFA